MTPEQRALFDKHVPTTRQARPDWTVCAHDSMTWPCETEKARTMLDRAERERDALRDALGKLRREIRHRPSLTGVIDAALRTAEVRR